MEWIAKMEKILCVCLETETEAIEIERTRIAERCPPYNIAGVPAKCWRKDEPSRDLREAGRSV